MAHLPPQGPSGPSSTRDKGPDGQAARPPSGMLGARQVGCRARTRWHRPACVVLFPCSNVGGRPGAHRGRAHWRRASTVRLAQAAPEMFYFTVALVCHQLYLSGALWLLPQSVHTTPHPIWGRPAFAVLDDVRISVVPVTWAPLPLPNLSSCASTTIRAQALLCVLTEL